MMRNHKQNWLVRCLAMVLAASLLIGLLAMVAFADDAQKINRMCRPENLSKADPLTADKLYFWGQNRVERGWVYTIEFHDTKDGVVGKYLWDFSAHYGDRSVIGWYEDNTLHIAADGKVTLDTKPAWMFAYFTNLKEVHFNDAVDTTGVTDMSAMFFDCLNLTELDVSGFDTSAVTNMSRMFGHCESLEKLSLGNFTTDQVSNFSYQFFNDKRLKELDVSSFRTGKAQYMQSMFYGCSGLTDLDISGFDTSGALTMIHMFDGCKGLVDLDFSTLSTEGALAKFEIPQK